MITKTELHGSFESRKPHLNGKSALSEQGSTLPNVFIIYPKIIKLLLLFLLRFYLMKFENLIN